MNFHLATPPSTMISDTNVGLLLRAGMFSLAMAGAFGLSMLVNGCLSVSLAINHLMATFLMIALPMLVGFVLGEVPRGSDWLLFRLGVATFCRTGLPLLIVVVVCQVSGVVLADVALGFLSFFYLFGFLVSVWISVWRYAGVVSVGEVDRAPI